MSALLRLQAVTLWRAATGEVGRMATFFVGASMAYAVWASAQHSDIVRLAAHSFSALAATAELTAMLWTSAAVDSLRWTAPVRPHAAFGAQLLFWAAVCSVLAFVPTCAVAVAGGEPTPWFALLAVLGVTAAAALPVFQRFARRSSEAGLMLPAAVLVVIGAISVGGAYLVLSDAFVAGAGVLAVGLGAALAVGAWATTHDERVPGAASGPVTRRAVRGTARTTVPDAACDDEPVAGDVFRGATREAARHASQAPLRARTLTVSILRAAWRPGMTALAAVVPFFAQAILPPGGMRLFLSILWVQLLAIGALPRCRWLLATPIDRSRAFRIVFAPVLLLACVVAATGVVASEFRELRTEFFKPLGDDRPCGERLVLGDVLRVDHERGVYCVPEIPFMTARVADTLRDRFGLRDAEPRIDAAIRRGWPERVDHDVMHDQDAVFAAMGRVHDDLADDLLAADRMRALVSAAAALLFALAILRGAVCTQKRWWWNSTSLVPLLVLMLGNVAELAPGSGVATWIRACTDAVFSAFQDAPAPVPALLFAACAAAGFLLWRSSENAFRRLDFTDFASSGTATTGWPLGQG